MDLVNNHNALRTRAACAASVCMAALAPWGIANAQSESSTADSDERTLNVVTVTARKTDETLQEVPVTVTAIGGDDLARYQVDQIADVINRVPALSVQVGGSGSGGQITLRGVGSSNLSAAFDSAVAFDFDGVQVSTMRIVQSGFFDTAQIDVLKGPQSLFFGKSASGGVFSIKSADPTPEWETVVRGSYEFEEKGYTIGGHISGPVSDTLGIRLAAQYNQIDEYLINTAPVANPDRGQENTLLRATLDWTPTDQFNANLKLNYVGLENDGATGHRETDCGADGLADPVSLFQGALLIPAGYDCIADDQRYFLPDGAAGASSQIPAELEGGDAFTSTGVGVPFGESDIVFGRLQMDYQLTDQLSLTSVSGYLDQDAIDASNYSIAGVGPAFTPVPGLTVADIAPTLALNNTPGISMGTGQGVSRNAIEQFSQEFRIASDFDSPFNFMLGAFYEDREILFEIAANAANIGLVAPDPITGNTSDYIKEHVTNTEAFSVFGSATYDFNEQWQLSGGLRWTEESKTNTISVPYTHAFLSAGGAFLASGFFSGPIEFEDDNLSPEVTLRYLPSDRLNLFASFKSGFKSGGIDNSALPTFSLLGLTSTDPAVRQATADGLIFQSETGEGGEIGAKTRWANDSVTLNATLYRYVYEDLQVQNFNGTIVQFETFNASELTTQGLDLYGQWLTPIDGLSLSGNLAYTDAQFSAPFIVDNGLDGIAGTADDVDLNGRDAANAPEWSGNISADWITPFGESLEFGAHGNLHYSGSYITNNDSLSDVVQDSYVSLDGALSIGATSGKWKLSLIGTNITDELWTITSADRAFTPAFVAPENRDQALAQNRGRQVFVELTSKF